MFSLFFCLFFDTLFITLSVDFVEIDTMQNGFKLISLNVRGIRDKTKRGSIFAYLKDQETKMYFLQEIYSEVNNEVTWHNEWGGNLFLSHGTHHSKGVCILIDPTLNYVIDSSCNNKSRRIVLITVLAKGSKISFCNIYAPNNQLEQLEFIQELNICSLTNLKHLVLL